MNDPETVAEQLDAIADGPQFGAALSNWMASLGKEPRREPDYLACHDYVYEGDDR